MNWITFCKGSAPDFRPFLPVQVPRNCSTLVASPSKSVYPGDDDANLLKLPILTVGGSADCSAIPEEVAAGYDTYQRPRAYAEIQGMTHYQFTASDEEDVEACPPGIPLETAPARLSSVMVPFFRWILAGDASLNAAIQQPAAGVTVELDW